MFGSEKRSDQLQQYEISGFRISGSSTSGPSPEVWRRSDSLQLTAVIAEMDALPGRWTDESLKILVVYSPRIANGRIQVGETAEDLGLATTRSTKSLSPRTRSPSPPHERNRVRDHETRED
jgi:hypothetical protein